MNSAPVRRIAQKPYSFTHHGVTLFDPYSWLKAENWQEVMKDPSKLPADICAILEQENAATEAWFSDENDFIQTLTQEMRGRIKEDDSSPPKPDGVYAYAVKYREGGQYPIFYRVLTEALHPDFTFSEDAVEILLDGDARGAEKPYYSLGSVTHSPCHKFLAWSEDDNGSEYYTIRIKDIKSGSEVSWVIPHTGGAVVWSPCSRFIFYVVLDDQHRPFQVYARSLESAADTLLYEEKNKGFFLSIFETQSRRFFGVSAHDHETSEVHLLDFEGEEWRAGRLELFTVRPREVGLEYSVDHGFLPDGSCVLEGLFIHHNKNAVDFQISFAALDALERWQDLIPHEAGRYITSFGVLRDYLIWLERRDARPDIVVFSLKEKQSHKVAFEEGTYSLGLDLGYAFEDTIFRFSYSSLATPSQSYVYVIPSKQRVKIKEQVVPSGHNPSDYIVERLWAKAFDGADVPLSVLRHKDVALDGSAPLYLYGYGSYGISIPASFSTTRLSLAARGVICVIAHVRGGSEKGYQWYLDGKREKKINTFHDFIAAAEHLIQQGYTAQGNIVSHGGSAGGMLMGAIANLRPDLFKGIIADVPFVDVLNTMLDASLPLTPPEWPEWGNPIESVDAFQNILSFSPYDGVRSQNYPAIFALGGLTDPRVTYWEPLKWIAKLRDHHTGDTPLLLKINMDAGHGGASGRFRALEETAEKYTFALKLWGKLFPL